MDDGFFEHDTDLVAFVINVCAPTATVDAVLADVAATMPMPLPPLPPQPSAVLAAALERRLWPAKLVDSGLPSFLVPITRAGRRSCSPP